MSEFSSAALEIFKKKTRFHAALDSIRLSIDDWRKERKTLKKTSKNGRGSFQTKKMRDRKTGSASIAKRIFDR